MFFSPRKRLPAVDYVSIIRSLYADRQTMLYGMLCSAAAALPAGVVANSPLLIAIALAFVVVAIVRDIDMRAFERRNIAPDDVEEAYRWEVHATVLGLFVAALHGYWCYVGLNTHDGGFAAISSILVTVSSLAGLVARNFAVERIVRLQSVLVALPLALGLMLKGTVEYIILALLLTIYIAGLARLATNLREILLGAVHGRIDASRLAVELDTALATMTLGLCMLDETGRVAVVNRHAKERVLGMRPGRWIGRMFDAVIAEAQRDGLLSEKIGAELLEAVALGGRQRRMVFAVADGSQCEVTINTEQGHTVILFEDITERVRAQERINYMAHYDGLTGLANRSYFSEEASRMIGQLGEGPDQRVQLMLIDLDDFKHVNDTYGHPVGDELLKEAAARVRSVYADKGLVARFGGDEFTLFRNQGVNEETARQDAEAVLRALRRPFHLTGRTLTTHASVGVVLADKSSDLDMLLSRADLALYQAKGNGKAQWSLFREDMDIDYRQRQRLKADLPAALENGELSLVYQPIVDLKTRRIIGCEALARWNHRELGRISPMVFVPIAEEIGAMNALSRWVLSTATAECARWPDPLRIAVNLSATDFRTSDVAQMVDEALKRSGLAPHRLEVEITESILIEEQETVARALNRLRERGVGIALDDFGTGYSSLSYLHAMPFTKLKIDRSFVVDVTTSPRSLKLVANIARLSKDLDMVVTVEGIETEAQLTEIAACAEIDQAQGYLFGVPLPQREVAELIARVATKGGKAGARRLTR